MKMFLHLFHCVKDDGCVGAIPTYVPTIWVTHVIIVACLRMHICTFVLLVFMIFGTTIPISFNTSMEMFLLYHSVACELLRIPHSYCRNIFIPAEQAQPELTVSNSRSKVSDCQMVISAFEVLYLILG